MVAKPSYPIEEDGNEDGFSNFIPTFQRVYKQWQMWFYAPEWVADACSLIPLHDYVTIYPSYGNGVSYSASDVDFNLEWMENKGLAKIILTFRRDAVVKTYYGNNNIMADEHIVKIEGPDIHSSGISLIPTGI